jgi:hypothetical protein
MSIDVIRKHYDGQTAGTIIPRWGSFERAAIGELLAALDAALADAARYRDLWKAAEAERDRLRAALDGCEVSMDTAAFLGLPQQLGPAYRDSWARAHQQARAELEQFARAHGNPVE